MDLNPIAVFVRVAETGSFTAAAEHLGLPKSSVSRAVTRLEAELGVRLLQRTTRAVRLTDTGRAYFERTRRALASLDEATELALDSSSEPRGVVRMTAPIDAGGVELAEVLGRFLERYPHVQVELALTARFVDLVEEGFDLAIRGGVLQDSSLVARKVGQTDFALFASEAYIEARGTPRTVEELEDHACIAQQARVARATWELSDPSGRLHSLSFVPRIAADELLFVRQAVEAGLGIGLLPIAAISRCGARGKGVRLVHVLPAWARRGHSLYVVTPPLELTPRRVLALRDHLVEALTPLFQPV